MMDHSDQGLYRQHQAQRDPNVQRVYRQNLYNQNPYLQAAYQVNLHKEEQYAFPSQHQTQPFYQDMAYGTYVVNPQQPLDDYYGSYGPEYADFLYPGMVQDEFGDMEEISTRPRLTKEQVEVLESQFQANHKPNSQVKRQLAIQTKLTLPRVANWFQNRRAKAKQQKKQEEFEAQNGGSTKSGSDGRSTSKAASSTPSSPAKSNPSPTRHSAPLSVSQESPSPTRRIDTSKEASWASLQRALNQAKAAQTQQPTQVKVTMPPPELPPQTSTIKLPLRISQAISASRMSFMDTLSHRRANAEPYPSPITLQDNTFDFGFDQDGFDTTEMTDPIDPSANFSSQSFVVTPEDWDEPLTTPKNIVHQSDVSAALPSPGLTMPSYPGSRRQSTTEELSNNFNNFALVNSSPNIVAPRRESEVIRAPENGNLDIAARRKRPRPAALTSSSLRSRSYGAMTSVSPTFRQGVITPQAPHTVRHVKSAGHGLNSRYAGVRKASSAQRSPMCVASFAEAEAFRQLMGQQATVAQSLTELPQPLLSPDIVSGQLQEPEKNPFFAQNIDVSHQYQRPLHVASASPPITPMAADFMGRGLSQQSLIPPASAPPQFASFPDYTPPYSAGPLTSSSWSDAPLTSPDVPSFPPVTYVPSLGYPQQCDVLSTNNFQQFVLPSDPNTDFSLDSQIDHKRTEFFIQEFPNQKREHAHVAQQLAQQKPKSYVFNNSAPHDYDQE